ncbi:hypothetical protein [Paraliomyxa miuraensis]|uniref:hypothetical protein n=1 Tax=Paraliomyxa miuraensis TaxID=376150 RepID=UPI00225A7977|nr:hypothetical protein [Paraliomyxa miuraensis]MCX4242213.1 hypothetical protein [Paraliomyxa miuraensis]
MPLIPSTINGVTVEFAPTVNRNVEQRMIDGLQHCIRTDIAPGHALGTIYISSGNDSHTMPSRHSQQKAVDISRINGKRMSEYYGADATVTAITDAIQLAFESYVHRRENFGPHIKHKLGGNYSVSGHGDHIHISVN